MDQPATDRFVVAVKFKYGDKTYDYWCSIPVEKGQRVYVPTARGGETKAEVVEIKASSERAELLSVIGLVAEEPAQ
jgi:primosomal protein N'